MLELTLPTKQQGIVPAQKLIATLNNALTTLFADEKLNCEFLTLDDDAILTITGDNITTTIHFQLK